MINQLARAFRYDGRVNVRGYWRAQLAMSFIVAACFAGSVALTISGAPRWVAALAFAPIVAVFVAALSITIRRLHDRGRSGWWLLIFQIAPWLLAAGVIWAGQFVLEPSESVTWTMLAAVLTSWLFIGWGFVEIGFLRGSRSENRFGPPAP